MNFAIFALNALKIADMLLGAGMDARPHLNAAAQVIQQAQNEGRDITDAEIAAQDADRHRIEQAIQEAAANAPPGA